MAGGSGGASSGSCQGELVDCGGEVEGGIDRSSRRRMRVECPGDEGG